MTSFVQAAHNSSSGGGTLNVTLSAAPTNGNLLLAWVGTGGATVPTVGTGWTIPTSGSASGGTGGSARCAVWAWKVAGSGESTTQAPFTAPTAGWAVSVLEYSLLNDSVAPIENANVAIQAAATALVTPSVSPASGNGRTILAGYNTRVATSQSFSAEAVNSSTTGVAEEDELAGVGTAAVAVADLFVASTSGTYSGSATAAASSVSVNGILVVKMGVAGAAARQQTLTLLGVGI